MLNLALDTATPWGRFALARDTELLGYRPLNIQGSYADALMPVITDLLAEAGCTLDQVGGIGITMGPGSFTGVRIGVATAKALAYALDCELVAVTTLEAMAGALLADHGSADLAVPVLDARRGEVFAGVFARESGWVRPLSPPAARSPERWWQEVMTLVEDPEAPIYGGEGAHLLRNSEAVEQAVVQEAGRLIIINQHDVLELFDHGRNHWSQSLRGSNLKIYYNQPCARIQSSL